jgi:hypothetical protein
LTSHAQNKRLTNVEAKIEVRMEGNYSKAAMEQKAIQAAHIQALGQEFGYAIVQGINTQTKSISGQTVMTTDQMSAISNTMVKGEWVSDQAGFPKLRYTLRDKGNEQEIWLICEVKGKAREIEQAEVVFETFVFNCQEPRKCNSGQFTNGDSMYLYFRTPTKGYLSVFMIEGGMVYRLLPYAQMEGQYESCVKVEADKEYLLFSPEHRQYFEGFPLVDEYELNTADDGQPLANLVYVLFSSEPFAKPTLTEYEGIKTIDINDFQKWINRNKGLDKNFQVSTFGVTVNTP